MSEYKYLGIYFYKFLDFMYHENIISGSSQRAIGTVIVKYKYSDNMGWQTYQKLCDTCVLLELNYGAEV